MFGPYFRLLEPGENPLEDDIEIPKPNMWLILGWLLAVSFGALVLVTTIFK